MIPTLRLPSWLSRKSLLIAGSLLLLVGIAALYVMLRASPPLLEPTHRVVLPSDRSVEELGGWQRISPPNSDPIFAFNDTIEQATIIVSQQPIPESFGNNIEAEVKKVAEGFSATTVFEVEGTPVYIGRSARGPQSVILRKNNLLLLIKSDATVPQSEWVRYISALTDPKESRLPTF